MGTETRRPPGEFIPPVAEPYEYIIFRASQVKDLAVDEAAAAAPAPKVRRSVHDDPAVVGAGPQPQQPRQRRADSVHTAMESVERAIGEIQQQQQNGAFKVPTTDFDFSASNARFTKPEAKTEGVDEVEAYNPQKSFFDTLTPQAGPAHHPNPGRGRGRGRGRRQEERDRNVATFGEPGGVGLLGPGAYVGGWGRRGGAGGRGRGRGVPSR